MEIVAKHYRTGEPIFVKVEEGRYASLENLDTDDYMMPWIAPGLVDIQVNGFAGVDFNLPPAGAEAWEQACHGLYAQGCTHFLATFITNTEKGYQELLRTWEPLRKKNPWNNRGYHWEGPFLNPDPGYRGAHQPDWMKPASIALLEKWRQASADGVRLVTMAPEVDLAASLTFIRHAVKEGVRIALGHSAAMGETLREACEAGADAWTHLGNAAPNPMAKFDNVIFHALAQEELRASLIPDRHHVSETAFKVMARALGERLLLTTDAMAGAGARPGSYTLGSLAVTVGEDGLARNPATGRPAGSTLTPFAAVFQAATMSGLAWEELWDAFSSRPAQWLGIPHALKAGAEANFCLFYSEPKPHLQAVYARGQRADETR